MAAETNRAPGTDTRRWERYSLRQRIVRITLLLLTVVVFVVSWRALGVRYEYVATAPREIQDLLVRMVPPNWGYGAEIAGPLIETVHISILGTILAILLSLPVAYIGADNTTPNVFTYALGKFIIAGSRSVNVIIWALLFVIMFGPGALAGVLAVAIRSVGFVSKLLAEEIEEISLGQVEAVRATGATGVQTLLYGIVPQVKPAFAGIATYRWDINVRTSTILGFVGAGGIGVELIRSINAFRWSSVTMVLLAILAVVLFSEAFSAYVRRKVR